MHNSLEIYFGRLCDDTKRQKNRMESEFDVWMEFDQSIIEWCRVDIIIG